MPTALPYIAVAGAVLGAAGTVYSSISQAHASSYQAAVDRNNAIQAQQNAQYAREAGQVKAELAGRQAAQNLAKVRTAIAANNIDVNSGSALDVQKGTRETGYLTQETVANNAALQAYGYDTQATGYSSQAALDESKASTAIPGGLLAATGSLASNAALIPGKFSSWSGNSEPAVGAEQGVWDT